MKKIFVLFVLFLVGVFLVFGQRGVHEPGTGITNPEIKEAGQGTGQGLQENVETETQNQGQDSEIRIQNQEQVNNQENNQGLGQQVREMAQERTSVQSGNIDMGNGKQLQLQVENNNQIRLKSGNSEAKTIMKMTQERTETGAKLQVQLSNGKNAEIKVMPDTASERALERLRLRVCSEENNCQIELKEVGSKEQVRAAYEIRAEKQAKLFGLFKTKMQVKAQVDAENGEVIQEKRPWWAFLAKEE